MRARGLLIEELRIRRVIVVIILQYLTSDRCGCGSCLDVISPSSQDFGGQIIRYLLANIEE